MRQAGLPLSPHFTDGEVEGPRLFAKISPMVSESLIRTNLSPRLTRFTVFAPRGSIVAKVNKRQCRCGSGKAGKRQGQAHSVGGSDQGAASPANEDVN